MPERMQYWVNRLEPNDQRDAALEVEVAAFLDDLKSALSRCKTLRSGAAGRRLLAPATREIQPCLVTRASQRKPTHARYVRRTASSIYAPQSRAEDHRSKNQFGEH